MKFRNRLKLAYVALLLLLLVVVLAVPAAAQGPEDGEVGTQAAVITGFVAWNPPFMDVPIGGATAAINRVHIDGAEQIWAIDLVIGYDAFRLTPDLADIQPGHLVPGTRGVDYFMDVSPLTTPPACAVGPVPAGFRVSIAYTSSVGPIEGSGTLIEIPWRSLVGGPPTAVCIDASSQIVDQSGSGGPVPGTPIASILTPVAPASQFRIGLQGGVPPGKPANLPPGGGPPEIPAANVTNATVNGIPCVLPPLGVEPICSCGSFPCDVQVQRPGYLEVDVTFNTAADVRSVYMLAGDANGDNQINILDLQQLASLLGIPVFYAGADSPAAERADFNFSGAIDIGDLVLAAWNFGQDGPTDGAVPPGVDF